MYKLLFLIPLLSSCVVTSDFPDIEKHYAQLVSGNNYYCGAVVIDKNRVLTAHHCILNGDGVLIYNGREIPFKVIKSGDYMKSPDLALLKAKVTDACLRYGDLPKPKEKVYVYSTPLNLKNLYTSGIVSGVKVLARDWMQEYGYFTIHTAYIGPGSSGSGVFNEKGQLIGINARVGDKFSLAVPIDQIKEFYAISEKRC